jgi:hypothetical protein
MKLLASLAIVTVLCGCETPRQTYVKQHPELSPQFRKIILAGRIKFNDQIAGMTRDQVRLVMGSDPDQFDAVNGEDTWTWFKSKIPRISGSSAADTGDPARESGAGKRGKFLGDSTASDTKAIKTTVYFKGNLATHVEVGAASL